MAGVSQSRRAFLRGRAPDPALMRPPWARLEATFLELCTKCGDCLSACPEQVLSGLADRTPTVTLGAGECTFCSACVDACASDALSLRNSPPWPDWVAVVGADCLAARGIVCQACRDSCPESAIAFAPSATALPHIADDRCTACGSCASVCPANAIDLLQINPTSLTKDYLAQHG